MGARTHPQYIPVDEYLEGELMSDVRHEYIGGEVYAMVGASDRHNLIAGNLFAALRPHVRGSPCQLFISDMKVRLQVAGEDAFYYPDLMLACDRDDRATYYRSRPCLIVEVLSETTERIDRREKLLAYAGIESLREYVLIAQERAEVQIHRREDGWRKRRISEGEVSFECLDVSVPLATLYEDVTFP